MATNEEKLRNRIAGDYMVLAELLGNGGRVVLAPRVPYLPGSWKSQKLEFTGVPATTASVFLRTGAKNERITQAPTGSTISLSPSPAFPPNGLVEYVAFYDSDDRLTAFGSFRS
jgi:hypothetical protein